MKVTKEITFDAAHMLSNYSGKCHNLHGHTYKLQVTLEGPVCKKGNSQEMVMDFNELKQYMEAAIASFDHAIVFSDEAFRSDAENALLRWAEKYGMNYVIIRNGKSTSEAMAVYLKGIIEDMVDLQSVKVSVKLWETPTSFAEV